MLVPVADSQQSGERAKSELGSRGACCLLFAARARVLRRMNGVTTGYCPQRIEMVTEVQWKRKLLVRVASV